MNTDDSERCLPEVGILLNKFASKSLCEKYSRKYLRLKHVTFTVWRQNVLCKVTLWEPNECVIYFLLVALRTVPQWRLIAAAMCRTALSCFQSSRDVFKCIKDFESLTYATVKGESHPCWCLHHSVPLYVHRDLATQTKSTTVITKTWMRIHLEFTKHLQKLLKQTVEEIWNWFY